MKMLIAVALSDFQLHLNQNLGKPIGLDTVAAFSKLVYAIVQAFASETE